MTIDRPGRRQLFHDLVAVCVDGAEAAVPPDGDTYRDEIMKELAAARAVIVIWTQASIASDWARAEAGGRKPRAS